MAASDSFYRNQRTLDIVFAVSCVAMLASLVWMFAQDYYRPYKAEQRAFRDVEVSLNQQLAVLNLPDADDVLADEQALKEAQKVRKEKDAKVLDLTQKINDLKPKREKAEAKYQDVKSQHDSVVSFYDIAVEETGPTSSKAQNLKETIKGLKKQLSEAQADRDNLVNELLATQRERDAIEEPVTKAMTKLKKSYEKFDALIGTAAKKEWTVYDSIRGAWIVDAFQSPTKIQQFTLNDVPINYNFKYVTRFDRCMTCHQGIDRAPYSKEALKALRIPDEYDEKGLEKLAYLQSKLAKARQLLIQRKKALMDVSPDEAKKLPDPDTLVLTFLNKDYLTDARINEYAAHPRLDLFVGSNSKHPAEKIGCSACHSGQGSATDFNLASHMPNNSTEAGKWKKDHGWASNHFWDYPMLPKRFVESSCVKCHHEVTDLITTDNKNEAPQLLKGYNLVRELGCFGCHEISGIKNGKKIGPDMRLEPVPPLDKMLPEDRAAILADPDNPPGTLAKVGPSLYRLFDKTNEQWAIKWLAGPRSFRPDTKMPHFYNLSNNSKEVLPEHMKEFPAAEMHSVAHYLFKSSKAYLKNVKATHESDKEHPDNRARDEALLQLLVTQGNLPDLLKNAASMDLSKAAKDYYLSDKNLSKKFNADTKNLLDKLSENGKGGSQFYQLYKSYADKERAAVKKDLDQLAKGLPAKESTRLTQSLALFDALIPLTKAGSLSTTEITALETNPKVFFQQVKDRIAWRDAEGELEPFSIKVVKDGKEVNYQGDPVNGRKVFSERGCLACHHHDSTMKPDEAHNLPALPSEQHFGPDLSQIKEKLGKKPGDKDSAAVWLSHWIKNPQGHSPRSAMPKVPLTDPEILDVTAWLLDQPAGKSLGSDWDHVKVETPRDEEFFNLAHVYLERLLPKSDLDKLHKMETGDGSAKKLESAGVNDLPEDEKRLVQDYTVENVKMYLGKKAIGRQGCFACHDIPGFDDAKNIGVALNDWGKKDPAKLAFEDIEGYFDSHYYVTDDMTIKQGPKAGKAQPFKHGEEDGHNGHGSGHGGKAIKKPYEKFFADALFHHDRVGFLNQKLLEPRSYDWNRDRAWDDLARMPQFKFARPGHKPGESEEEYEARAWKEETEAREAVMTFILGLVAEPVPTQSISQPKGDRLDVIKGKKVLDKFNCTGCHMVQPSTYEFDFNKHAQAELNAAYKMIDPNSLEKDFDFPYQQAWSGKTPKQNQPLTAYGMPAMSDTGKILIEDGVLTLKLTSALRFEDAKGIMLDIRGKEQAKIPIANLVYPPAKELQPLQAILDQWTAVAKSEASPDQKEKAIAEIATRFQEAYAKFESKYGTYGGTFANLLPLYLAERAVMSKYKALPKEFGERINDQLIPGNLAYAASPPRLMDEGERTQPDWLYQFLLNPQPIRKIVVLRMPKFNLSDNEAKALVKYFSAASRLANPKSEIAESYVKIPQQTNSLDDPYWRNKTKAYVDHLKKDKLYAQRVEELTPVWKKIEQVQKDELSKAEKQLDQISKDLKGQKKPDLALQEAERVWKDEVDRLKELVKKSDPKKQEEQWADTEAYVTDAFRLLGNNQVCAKCHQIGNLQPAGKETEGHGPPLALAHKRLKPGWVKHWVANPPRMLPYSPMPQYFSKGVVDPDKDKLFHGASLEQVQALTDVLMIYDRAIDLPVIRYSTLLPQMPGKKE